VQVVLSYYGSDDSGRMSILVSWATCDAIVQSTNTSGDCTGPAQAGIVTKPLSTTGLVSRVYWGIDRGNTTQLKSLAEGNATAYVYDYLDFTGIKYASPVLHHVLIKGRHGQIMVCIICARQGQHMIAVHSCTCPPML
jgi:hypothetical protein